MFNLFPKKKSVDEILENSNVYPSWTWTTSIKDTDGKDITVENLIQKYNELVKENKDYRDLLKSIEEDGTTEHNNAIKLRQENAKLKVEIDKWENDWDEQNKNISELMKEIKSLRHLKEENVQLIDRINKIDSNANKEYKAEIFTLKNECALLRAKNNTLQEFIDTKIKVDWKSARIDILERDLQKCAEQRDEYKHQLNAANKELDILKKEYEERLKELYNDSVEYKKENEIQSVEQEAILKTNKNLKETIDKLNLQITALHKIIEGGKETIDRQKIEITKLQDDIVDYVLNKDEEITELNETVEAFKNMKTQGFEDYDPSDFVEPQKHPMYPFHWGGYDKVLYIDKEIEFSAEELLKRATDYAETTAKNLKEKFDKGEDVLDYFEQPKWICPCNKCKKKRLDSSKE